MVQKEIKDGNEGVCELFREVGAERAVFTFDCGGDSMGDTELLIYQEDEKLLDPQQFSHLYTELEDLIYNEVVFYANSDGHYMGETGIVCIGINDDEKTLCFNKESEFEYNERSSEDMAIELTQEEADYILEFVESLSVVPSWDGSPPIAYKKDFIKTIPLQQIEDELLEKIEVAVRQFEPYDLEGEEQEFSERGWEAIIPTAFETLKLEGTLEIPVTIYRNE